MEGEPEDATDVCYVRTPHPVLIQPSDNGRWEVGFSGVLDRNDRVKNIKVQNTNGSFIEFPLNYSTPLGVSAQAIESVRNSFPQYERTTGNSIKNVRSRTSLSIKLVCEGESSKIDIIETEDSDLPEDKFSIARVEVPDDYVGHIVVQCGLDYLENYAFSNNPRLRFSPPIPIFPFGEQADLELPTFLAHLIEDTAKRNYIAMLNEEGMRNEVYATNFRYLINQDCATNYRCFFPNHYYDAQFTYNAEGIPQSIKVEDVTKENQKNYK